jgi:hypothetical protein
MFDAADLGGYHVTVGNATYCDNNATFKVEFAEKAADGTVLTKDAIAFKELCSLHGLSADDLGRDFTCQGRTFKIAGLKPRATKRPILCDGDDGKQYSFPAKAVIMGLKK